MFCLQDETNLHPEVAKKNVCGIIRSCVIFKFAQTLYLPYRN